MWFLQNQLQYGDSSHFGYIKSNQCASRIKTDIEKLLYTEVNVYVASVRLLANAYRKMLYCIMMSLLFQLHLHFEWDPTLSQREI